MATTENNERTEGSYGMRGNDVSVSGNTHITGRDTGSYSEIGQDIVFLDDVGVIHASDREEGSYGVFGAKSSASGPIVISDREDGSYGTGDLKSTVTYTESGATVISDRTSSTFGSK